MTDEDLLDVARRLSQALRPADLDETLRLITGAAVEVIPGAQYSSITVLHADGRLETVAPTDDLVTELDDRQHELREGPCYEAVADTVHIVTGDLVSDSRFPRYGAAAAQAGIRSQAGVRLFETPTSRGALDLYSLDLGAFDDLGILGRLFAHQSAQAIEYAREVENLQRAMRTRKTIGQAIGILMERYGLTDARAFAFLTRLSSHRNVKLNAVAEEMVAEAEQRGEAGPA